MAIPSSAHQEDDQRFHKIMEDSFKDLGVKYPSQQQDACNRARDNIQKAIQAGSLYTDIIKMDVKEKPRHRKEYSVKVTFPAQGKPYLRDEVLAAVSSTVDAGDIVGAGPLQDNSKWIFTLRNKEALLSVLGSPPSVRGNQGRSFSLTKELVTCRIHWLPLYVPMATVAVYMSRFGVVHSLAWDYSKIPDFTHVRSTVRNVVLELDSATVIPSLDTLHYKEDLFKYLITIPGRGPVCFRCSAVGHTRAECKSPYCRVCQVYDHSTEDCARQHSYAGKASAGKPKDEEHEPCDLEEDLVQGKTNADSQDDKGQADDHGSETQEPPEDQGGDNKDADISSDSDADEMQSIPETQDDFPFSTASTLMEMVKEQEPEIFDNISEKSADSTQEDGASIRKRLRKEDKATKGKGKKKGKDKSTK